MTSRQDSLNEGKQLKSLVLLFVIASLAVTAATWMWYFNNPPSKIADYATIKGTLVSFAELGPTKSPYLDFSIRENPARFCVPMDGYRESFDSYTFIRNAKGGETVWLTAQRSELLVPKQPSLGPTIFVAGLKDSKTVYSIPQDRIKWEINNRELGRKSAIAFTIITALEFGGMLVWRLKGADIKSFEQQKNALKNCRH